MGFLHKLWDETLAGPAPESGLGKLRKYNSMSAARSGNDVVDVPVSRSITILRTGTNPPSRHLSVSVEPSGYTSESPTGSTPPLSPFPPGTPSAHLKRSGRRKSSAEALPRADPSTLNDFDRIFLSGLDR